LLAESVVEVMSHRAMNFDVCIMNEIFFL